MIKLALISHFVLWGGVSLDIGTTWRAPQYEMNPILGTSRLQQGAIVIGSAAAIEAVTWKLEKHHPRAAAVIRLGIGAEHLVAGIHNLHAQ